MELPLHMTIEKAVAVDYTAYLISITEATY